jgi:hypothetical protein
VIIGFPAVTISYWWLVLKSGMTSGGGVLELSQGHLGVSLAVTPIVVAVAWASLRRYNPDTSAFAWRTDRRSRSVIATVLFGGAAIVMLTLVLIDIGRNWPSSEYLWLAYAMLWVIWLLSMRAAIVDRL